MLGGLSDYSALRAKDNVKKRRPIALVDNCTTHKLPLLQTTHASVCDSAVSESFCLLDSFRVFRKHFLEVLLDSVNKTPPIFFGIPVFKSHDNDNLQKAPVN